MPEPIKNAPETKEPEQLVIDGFENAFSEEKEKEEEEKNVPAEEIPEITENDNNKPQEPKKPADNPEKPKDAIDIDPDKSIKVKPQKVHNESEFLPKIEKKRKITLSDILLAPIRFLKFVIKKAIAFLDRFTGYNDLNIKSPDIVAAERNRDAKTPSEVKEEALELGAKDKNLVEKAKEFESFLNNTYGLDGRSFEISPIQYKGLEPMLNVKTVIDGKTFIDTIGVMSDCCLHTNTSAYGITNGLNAAWMKYTSRESNERAIQDSTKVLRAKLKEIATELQKGKNPVLKHQRKGIMLNGVYLYVSATSALKGEPEITVSPYLVTHKAQTNNKVFPGLDSKYTFSLSELSKDSTKLNEFVTAVNKASRNYYSKSFDRDMNKVLDRAVANKINTTLEHISHDFAECVSVKPLGIEKGTFKLELTSGNDKTEIKFNRSGNIIGNFDGPEKPLLEALATHTVAMLVTSNTIVTPEYLKQKVFQAHDKIKKCESKGESAKTPKTYIKIGHSNITISKDKDSKNDNLVISQKSLINNESKSLSNNADDNFAVINVNSDDKEFQKITDLINKNNSNIIAEETYLMADMIENCAKNIIVERNLDIDTETFVSTEKDIDKVLEDANKAKDQQEQGVEQKEPVEKDLTEETEL